jgi:DNA polymerase-1
MNPSAIIADLAADGLTLIPEGTGLRVSPASRLTPAHRQLIRENAAALLAAVRGYVYIVDPSQLPTVISAVRGAALVALDTETTGLNPRADKVRLLQLATGNGVPVYLIDLFRTGTEAIRPVLDALGAAWAVFHNALFDVGFLERLGYVPGVALDTMLLSILLYGPKQPKGFHSLAGCVERELGRALDKEEQRSDWGRPDLTPAQLAYAAADVAALSPLYRALRAKIEANGLAKVAKLERRALPAVAWLAGSGVRIDRPAWEALALESAAEAERRTAEANALAPPRPGDEPVWNFGSAPQVKGMFALLGVALPNTKKETLAGLAHPLADAICRVRSARKRVETYGPDWLKCVNDDGRVYADWYQIGCRTGRMSCQRPGLQQLPRDKRFRRCFVAPPGRAFVKADYSQIELRVAAKVTGDRALTEVFKAGGDVHALTARAVLGADEVTAEQRHLAKAIGFGLLFGMGAATFRAYAFESYGVALTLGQAEQYRQRFFAAYPGLRRWHGSVPRRPIDTRTLTGRLRRDVADFTAKLNSPIQGTGADGLKTALALLYERRDRCPGAFPVLAVHDELVCECDESRVAEAAEWLRQAMLDGMAPLIDPVPVEIDVKVGTSWGSCVPLAEYLEKHQPERSLT